MITPLRVNKYCCRHYDKCIFHVWISPMFLSHLYSYVHVKVYKIEHNAICITLYSPHVLFNKYLTIRTTCVYSIVYTFWLWSYHHMWCFFKQFAICIFKNFIFIHVHPSDHVHTISVMLHFTFFFVEHKNNNVGISWNLYYKCRQFIIK